MGGLVQRTKQLRLVAVASQGQRLTGSGSPHLSMSRRTPSTVRLPDKFDDHSGTSIGRRTALGER